MQLPSITINSKSKIIVRRLLPAPGEILVIPGQRVDALTVVARAETPSGFHVIDVARQLGRLYVNMEEVLLVEEGDYVEVGQIIATKESAIPFMRQSATSPVAGYVTAIGAGWVLLETERTLTEIQAFINGMVTRTLTNRGVVIEADGAIVQARCGFGGEAYGRLRRMVNSPYEALTADVIDESVSDTILLAGRTIDEETLRLANEWQVRGIIVGSISSSLKNINPPVQVRVVATEGFGDVPMSPYTFGVLTSLSRREISIRGQTLKSLPHSTNPMENEPPIILAAERPGNTGGYNSTQPTDKDKQKKPASVDVGSRVRVIQGKHLGVSGTIDLIPPEPQATQAGVIVPGAYVKLSNEVHFIPWANLEQIT